MRRVASIARSATKSPRCPTPSSSCVAGPRPFHTSTPSSTSCSTSSTSLGECSLSRASLHRSRLPPVTNEPMLNFAPGSHERAQLKKALARIKSECPEIPCIIGGKHIKTGNIGKQVMPSDHQHVLCTFHEADETVTREAITTALAARKKWEEMPWEDRASIFLKAADLLSHKYHWDMLACTMLGQGKNVWQAEIDACAEMADFWRFNVKFAQDMYENQPTHHAPGTWNRVEYRALEGFVFAISPFNFSAIGANLASAPTLMGNVVLWKPSPNAMLSNYLIYRILEEAGLPAGVINLLPGDGLAAGKVAFAHKDFAGLHFTGSTKTFQTIWSTIGSNIANYRSFPRIVGETGGKNFHFIHESADIDLVVNQTIRGAFEYSGQKCSATSRMYVPDNLWPEIRRRLTSELPTLRMGQPDDMETFISAVIDQRSFEKCVSYIERAKQAKDAKIIVGGTYDMSRGYFVHPTIIETTNPHFLTMTEEIFGPVLTVYVYPQDQYKETLKLCDQTASYALTGSIFARDRYALEYGSNALRHSAGNFYVNDKSTGAVVGQQPFGGGRGSGTNDKAGAPQNLARWVSPRAIKETFVPITTWKYPHQNKEQ